VVRIPSNKIYMKGSEVWAIVSKASLANGKVE
jgi:hypothetical protein